MTIFRNVVFLAALAGLVAGLFLSAVQAFQTTPLIIHAESFEGAEEEHVHGAADAGHSHDEEAWMPADGFERVFYTSLANVATAIGFGLLLIVASEFAGGIANWREGLFWGLGGFAVFTLAPGLGLPPELPGMPAADLVARQVWWIGTAAATAAGLALIVFRRSGVLAVVGAALLVAPHLIGAPHPESHETLVPPDLHHNFVVAVTVSTLLFWLALGAIVGLLRSRFLDAPTPRERLA